MTPTNKAPQPVKVGKVERAVVVKSLTPADLTQELVTDWANSRGLVVARPAVQTPAPKEVKVGEFLIAVEEPKYSFTWTPEAEPPAAADVVLGRLLERTEALIALGKKPFLRIEADDNAKNRARLRLFVLT